MKRDIPVHVINFSVLDQLLILWSDAVKRGGGVIGFPKRSTMLCGDGARDFEELCSDADGVQISAMSAMIESELAKHYRWAIKKSFGVSTVWNYPNLDFMGTLQDALADLEIRARRNKYTACRF